jgi:uncharacterized protein
MKPPPEKKVWFRFYEELNDFLPAGKVKQDIIYVFKGNPSVKDAIEAQNIPHTEVDLIIVNGNPVDFSYKLNEGDRVSVYPVFETFDITSIKGNREKPARETRFILDVHLGKLAKYLRMAGFDTKYRNNLEDSEIITISLEENRIILTRDRGILKNKMVQKGYYLRSQNPRQQLMEIIQRFQLQGNIRFLSRCIACNGIIFKVPKEEIEQQLMPGTRNNFEKFYRCGDCMKVYWKGSHYERMMNHYRDINSGTGGIEP